MDDIWDSEENVAGLALYIKATYTGYPIPGLLSIQSSSTLSDISSTSSLSALQFSELFSGVACYLPLNISSFPESKCYFTRWCRPSWAREDS